MAGNLLNFTKESVENITPPEKGYVTYRDTGSKQAVPGLVLRVYANGKKSFFLSRWIDNKSEYYSIGRYPTVHPENARTRAKELNAQVTLGKNPVNKKRKVRAEMPLSELFEKYMLLHAKPSKRTWKNDQKLL